MDALRDSPAWIPALSWVAERDGGAVGHVRVHPRVRRCGAGVGLGPLGVMPTVQRQGIGSSLVYGSIGAADALGEPLIALLGAPGYYGRFGFAPGSHLSIHPPEPSWGEHFQVRTLASFDPSITGTFTYASRFTTMT